MGLVALALAYLIGGIPTGWLLVRWRTGKDIRAAGSGNIGATNVLRTAGGLLGALTLAADIAKGALAVWLAGLLTHRSLLWMSLAAVAVLAGHAYPALLKFRGGKAVASFIGAWLYLTPVPMLAVLAVFAVLVWRTRFVSLGSITAAATFPLAVWLIEHPPAILVTAAVLSAGLIVWRHRKNIERLRAGRENTLSFGGRRS
jgi:acyl phosphate:glycerol-3-phosphate acyltransferase